MQDIQKREKKEKWRPIYDKTMEKVVWVRYLKYMEEGNVCEVRQEQKGWVRVWTGSLTKTQLHRLTTVVRKYPVFFYIH